MPYFFDYFSKGSLNFICWRPPYLFLEILRPFKVSCNPLDIKKSHKSASILSLRIGQIDPKFSFTKFGHPFLEIGDPQKGRDPLFENLFEKSRDPQEILQITKR